MTPEDDIAGLISRRTALVLGAIAASVLSIPPFTAIAQYAANAFPQYQVLKPVRSQKTEDETRAKE